MLIRAAARTPADDMQVAREVSAVLERRAAMSDPPASLVISDAVALAVAGLFRGPTPSGRVMDRFFVARSADSDDLIQAAQFEQGYATAEEIAALSCLIRWVNSRSDFGSRTDVW